MEERIEGARIPTATIRSTNAIRFVQSREIYRRTPFTIAG